MTIHSLARIAQFAVVQLGHNDGGSSTGNVLLLSRVNAHFIPQNQPSTVRLSLFLLSNSSRTTNARRRQLRDRVLRTKYRIPQ